MRSTLWTAARANLGPPRSPSRVPDALPARDLPGTARGSPGTARDPSGTARGSPGTARDPSGTAGGSPGTAGAAASPLARPAQLRLLVLPCLLGGLVLAVAPRATPALVVAALLAQVADHSSIVPSSSGRPRNPRLRVPPRPRTGPGSVRGRSSWSFSGTPPRSLSGPLPRGLRGRGQGRVRDVPDGTVRIRPAILEI